MSANADPRLPLLATYRLQLTSEFTFADAQAALPYLHALGITHLYLSPILHARAASSHGYDVVDPTRVSAALGGEDGLRALADESHRVGMGIIVDLVPNHMGIGADNPAWEDLLTHGERAPRARWFDVDWEAHPRRKLVLPVLGDELDAVMARGELRLSISESGGVRLAYFDHSFPLDPATVPEELQLVQWDPHARDAAVAWAAGDEGRARLRALLEDQHYALVFWRRAPTRINYRRFFDVNDLAALRVEDPVVFDETHALVLRLVAEGIIDGLRIDHVDGLRDPLGYLTTLRARLPASTPVFVEKILSSGERLRREWPVQGTTGYEFMNDIETLFLDPEGTWRVEDAYRRMRRLPQREAPIDFEDIARDGKLLVLRSALRADMLRLARALARTEERRPERATRDDERVLADGLSQLVASLPVYRTYIDGRTELPHPADREVIERAVAASAAHLGAAEQGVVARVARGFLAPLPTEGPMRAARLAFIQRFQQTSGPATAKGVEDTALYRYVPLASRNEVGGEPGRPVRDAVERFHAANAERAREWPASLLATNTHDTKRSADLRSRIDALTELPDEWLRVVHRWRRLNRRHRALLQGRLVPDMNTEWLLYQTLVGLWPAPRTGRRADDLPSVEWLESAAGRLRAYMMKAVKEAKQLTSWTDPDPGYEAAVGDFISAIMDPRTDSPFLSDVSRFVSRIARVGHWNALSRVLVHYTAPGTPDTYQGDECWTYTLVDPDNRRAVDFGHRATLLSELVELLPDGLAPDLATARLRDFVRAPEDERLKVLVAWRALQARRREPALFARGDYVALAVVGERRAHAFAFARVHDGIASITVVPRLTGSLGMVGHMGEVPRDVWRGTTLILPPELQGMRWRSAFTGGELSGEGEALPVDAVFADMPVGLLMAQRD